MDRSSILRASTTVGSVELYSFSRMSLRLYIDSRVANAALVFLFEKARFQEQKTERVPHGAPAPLATRRRQVRHREKAGVWKTRFNVSHAFFVDSQGLQTVCGNVKKYLLVDIYFILCPFLILYRGELKKIFHIPTFTLNLLCALKKCVGK